MSRTTAAPERTKPPTKKTKGKTPPVQTVKGTRISAAEACRDFAALLERVAGGRERVVIERDGKIVAFLGTERDLDLVVEDEEDREDLAAAEEAMREEGAVPWEKVKADAGL